MFDSGIEWRDGNYVLLWIDAQENVSLSYKANDKGYISIISPKITSVGKDDQFIVVQQRHVTSSSDTSYFVVKKTNDLTSVDSKENIIGPLSADEFRELKTSQNLPDFSKRLGAKDEKWRLIFVIPMVAVMLVIIPFFFAAWISTVILIFQGFKNFPTGVFRSQKITDLKFIFNLKKIIEAIKRDGWSLILVRTLGMSVAVQGFIILMILAGAVFLVERIISNLRMNY